jgi:hypothetical protein
MNKFKVGDLVRIIENKFDSCNNIGDIGYVVEVRESRQFNFIYRVSKTNDVEERGNLSREDDLELVNQSTPEPDYAALAAQHGIVITVTAGDLSVTFDGRATPAQKPE